MSNVPTLGYWVYRGLAAPIRYLLTYSGIEFIDKRYELAEEWNDIESLRKNWRETERDSLGLDFPNLPYYIDGDVKISQSVVIMRYLGRKYGLFANDEKSLARQDLIEQQLRDLLYNFIFQVLIDRNEFEKNKEQFLKETLPQQLQLLSKFLGNNEWLVGNLTYIDFGAYESLETLRLFSPECLDKFENLKQYLKRFESLPNIKAYLNSDKFTTFPIFPPIMCWGYH